MIHVPVLYFSYNGHWSDAGCEITRQTSTATAFKCIHLTNFAILVTGKLKVSRVSSEINYLI